jgi:predicted tellurium resistance membrane protein TerC
MEFFAFNWVTEPSVWLSLATLTALEIVLGIDNLVFIAILSERVAAERRAAARKVGLGLALGTRLALLAMLAWIATLTEPLFSVAGLAISWRDVILMVGGAFLLVKATHEMHNEVEGEPGDKSPAAGTATFAAVVTQIAFIDIIFSLDSVITAVGMADHLWVMALAVVAAMVLMMIASTPLAEFVSAHPTVKMLALAFLFVIGVVLIADGFDHHIPKGYVYFAMAFSVAVEALNIRMRRKRPASPVELREPYIRDGE